MTDHDATDEHLDADNPTDVYEAQAADAASDEHLVEARRAELARLREHDPNSADIAHIANILGENVPAKRAKPESASKRKA